LNRALKHGDLEILAMWRSDSIKMGIAKSP
jgi:hypothetical protein